MVELSYHLPVLEYMLTVINLRLRLLVVSIAIHPTVSLIANTTKSSEEDTGKWSERANDVPHAIRTSWQSYLVFADKIGSDDLAPEGGTGLSWRRAHATFFDSLDTLFLAGLKKVQGAVQRIVNGEGDVPSTDVIWPTKVFEYHVRIVGGILAAYSLSGDVVLLDAAVRAANMVIESSTFDKSSGLPRRHARLVSKKLTTKTKPGIETFLDWSESKIRLAARAIALLLDHVRNSFDATQPRNSLSGIGSFGLELE